MDSYRSTILFLIVLMALSATFSASETALTAANKIRLKNQAEDGDKRAAGALKLAEKYDSTLSGLLISNNIVNTLSASLTTVVFTAILGEGGVGAATAVITVLLVIFGEVLPKTFAANNAEKFIKITQKPLHILMLILTPFIKILDVFKNFLMKNNDETPTYTEQELISIVDEIEDEGVLEEDEADLVQSAIEFNDISASEILTPRVDICAIDKESTKDEILNLFMTHNYSRMPVYENSIDRIVGFINQKDFFAAVIKGIEAPIESLIKPCRYVPPKRKIIDVMHMLQKDKVHMAVVTDEYGGTRGIVTLEDILEQLVGDIWDEHDEETQQIFKADDTTYEVLGETFMEDVYEEILNTRVRTFDGKQTVSAYIMAIMERIPEQNESCSDNYLKYTVQIIDDNRIKKVQINVLQREDFEI